MMVNRHIVDEFELEFLKREKPDHGRSLKIMRAKWKEAVYLEVFPPQDPLDGIDVDEKIARITNSV